MANNDDRGKMLKVNVIPLSWAASVIEKGLFKALRKKNIPLILSVGTVCFFILGLGFAAWVFNSQMNSEARKMMGEVISRQREQLVVVQNAQVYRSLANFPNKVPVYVQWRGISGVLSSRGGILSSVVFHGTDVSALPSSMLNSIAVETGRGVDSLDAAGVWILDGRLAPDAEGSLNNTWLLECLKELRSVMAPLGINAYMEFVSQNGDGDFSLAVFLWRQGGS